VKAALQCYLRQGRALRPHGLIRYTAEAVSQTLFDDGQPFFIGCRHMGAACSGDVNWNAKCARGKVNTD
jgi:hypothetical protein